MGHLARAQTLPFTKPGFAADFYFHNFSKRKFLNLAHYFPYDVNLRISAHSRSFLANQKARNAIVGAENLLTRDIKSLTRDGFHIMLIWPKLGIVKI